MKYRKKPVIVEAIQYTGDNLLEVMKFCKAIRFIDYLYIATLESNMRVNIGDYVIKGVRGEFYPCEKNIFEETYEAVNTKDDYIKVEPKRPFF